MKKPPSFVMYVVMVKPPTSDKYDPCWELEISQPVFAKGFSRKRDAELDCRIYRTLYGKENAYVQQYGPYS